jgi:putative oxidoreductase
MITGFIRAAVTSQYLAFVLRILIGSFFLYASMSKIAYPAQFADAVANYRLIPYSLLNLGALVLPWVEFVAGLFLIIGFMSRASVILIGLMLIMFNVMVLINMYWGAPITCGCYDTVGEPIGWRKIAENGAMLIFAVQVYFFDSFLIFRRSTLAGPTRFKVAASAARR